MSELKGVNMDDELFNDINSFLGNAAVIEGKDIIPLLREIAAELEREPDPLETDDSLRERLEAIFARFIKKKDM